MARTSDLTGDLEKAIDAVVDSYDGAQEINSLESAALPNKRAVIEAFNHLKPAIFMGFYSLRSLNQENLRHSVSEHMYPAYELLCEQLHKAFTYEARVGRSPPVSSAQSHEALIRVLNQLPELRRKLNGDVRAAYEGDPAARSLEEIIFSYPAVEAITAYRIAHLLYQENVPMIPRIISEYAHSQTGVDIHPGARIGERFFLDHGTGVVIGETSEIGDNVKVYQGVTLGALSLTRSELGGNPRAKRHPTIEDEVTIYAGATILGGQTVIGKGSVIGGNTWIIKSVPAGSKIFGKAKDWD
jgi:serine O-acetyltransferase